MAIGVAGSAVPYASVDTAKASGASNSFAPVSISPSFKATTGNENILPIEPIVEARQASTKMASTVLSDSESVGVITIVPAETLAEYKKPSPAKSDNRTAIVKNVIAGIAEPKAVGARPPSAGLVATSAPIKDQLRNGAVLGIGISIPGNAGHQLGLNSMRPADQKRLIYGTSARNADKVYFPQQFSQSVGTLQAAAEIKQSSSFAAQIALDKQENTVASNGSKKGRAVVPSLDTSQTGTTAENQGPIQRGGYFEYEPSAEQITVESAVAVGDQVNIISIGSTPDASEATTIKPADASSGAASSGQSSEMGSAL